MVNNKKVVLITGANSMVGKALIRKFSEENWTIHATVRSKSAKNRMQGDNLFYHEMNLEKTRSIHKTIKSILKKETHIDLLINNAGYVLSGPFECLSDKQIKRQMDVNFFGAVHLIKAILPHLKTQKESTIINMSSLCGLITFPMLSMYHASKWALEGFSESLKYELEPFGIRVKLIEPGGIKEGDQAAQVEFAATEKPEYKELLQQVHQTNWFPSFSAPDFIANAVLDAALDTSRKLRYVIGNDCAVFLDERKNGFADESYLTKISERISSKK
jgi:NAD(P)-dependent dehydrogenase (short-subunit alcohol dehydrogenase family)